MKLFSPILVGVTLVDRLVSCVGALIGITLTCIICWLLFGKESHLPFIVAPMGASAVLLFVIPASPLAQPWPIVFGNTISALVGVVVGRLVGQPFLAAGIAVSVAIIAMTFTRSLHPPGGAAALSAIIGGSAVRDMGLQFPFYVIAINSLALVILGVFFHKLMRHNYPHRSIAEPTNVHSTNDSKIAERTGFTGEDIDQVISEFHDTLDIDRQDLEALLRLVEQRTLQRHHGSLTCADIMSHDVISISSQETVEHARQLLLKRHLHILPVEFDDGRLTGVVGWQELAGLADDSPIPVIDAVTAFAEDPVVSLLPKLTDGLHHGVIIVDHSHVVKGIISQTDLLAALGQMLLSTVPK